MKNAKSENIRLILSGEVPEPRIWKDFNGVGIIRSEYIYRRSGSYITTPKGKNSVSAYIHDLMDQSEGKPVWYRTADFEDREIATLDGADAKLFGENPILSDRGIWRAKRFPKAFQDEMEVLSALGQFYPNLNLLFSYVATDAEHDFAIAIARAAGWSNGIGCMVEIPSAIWNLESFCQREISDLVIGLNDLTSLMLGVDRPSQFADMTHSTIQQIVEHIIRTAHKFGKKVTIAGNLDPKVVEVYEAFQPDHFALHYSHLNQFFPGDYDHLEEGHVLLETKQQTAQLLELQRSMGSYN